MPGAHEQLTEQFRKWEIRGRGWHIYDEPVFPEPPFRPFTGHYLPITPTVDDGLRPTLLSSLTKAVARALSTHSEEPPGISNEPEPEPEPECLERDAQVELLASLPPDLDISREAFQQFLLSVGLCREPISFELLGVSKRVTAQFAAHPDDAPLVGRQLQAHFPEAVFQRRAGSLIQAWESCEGTNWLTVEFGLAREFVFPLEVGKFDPFVGVVGALSELKERELGLFQVLWQKVANDWSESIKESVTGANGKPFFVNAPELAKAADEKTSQPLFAAVVRILVRAQGYDRLLQIARDLAGSLAVFSRPDGNELIPLKNTGYDYVDHAHDALLRQTRRPGMIVNAEELAGLVHLPTSDVRSPVFQRLTGKTKSAPPNVRHASGIILGENEHLGEKVVVRLTPEQRTRHMHIIGASGTGKSNLLFNLIQQDIDNGGGLAVLDPHGDLVDRVLGIIPPERIDDVVLVDPSDEEYSVGFNVLVAHSELEKTLLASDLVAVFQRLSTSWGDQMNSVLQNAILAFLESDQTGTIADLRRFLIEPAFRAKLLKTVQDSEVVYYWQKGFPHLTGSRSIGPIVTRLDALLAKKPIRHMVSQDENRLDFGHIMDSGKIFLAKLPEGLLGRENSYLIGSLLISKFQQTAMSRQAQQITARRDFWLYVDEFANFITPSMAEILSGARKYRIGLTLAHHELHQLQRNADVASAVMSHPYTRIVFRVGDDDSKRLAEGFSYFEASDLRNLEVGQAVCRVERSDFDFNLTVPLSPPVDIDDARARRDSVVAASRDKYGRLRSDIEASLRAKLETEAPPSEPSKSKPAQPISPPPETKAVHIAEVPKAGEPLPVAIKPAVAEATPTAEPKPVVPVADKGIGGHQHNLIRERIEQRARQLGFTASREDPTGSGGKIDVVLKNASRAIACEIAITTTIDHEVGNVAKCLKAGFGCVAVISPSTDRLEKIQTAVNAAIPKELAGCVGYFAPDAFVSRLESWAAEDAVKAPAPTEMTFGKYKIKHSVVPLTPEELKEREEAALRLLGETMRKKKKKL